VRFEGFDDATLFGDRWQRDREISKL
jgi:hypothetical protein